MTYVDTEPTEQYDLGDVQGDVWRRDPATGLWRLLVGEAWNTDYDPMTFDALEEDFGPLTLMVRPA